MKEYTKQRVKAFLKGYASAFDLSGRTFMDIPDIKGGFARDREAIAGDWRRVGDDLRAAMGKVPRGR